MISDVLFEALEQIEWYQRNIPSVYSGIKTEIEEVKAVMRRLQVKLDTPPPSVAPDNLPSPSSNGQ